MSVSQINITCSSGTSQIRKEVLQSDLNVTHMVVNSIFSALKGNRLDSFSLEGGDAWRVDECLESLGLCVHYQQDHKIGFEGKTYQAIHLVPAVYKAFLSGGEIVNQHVILGGDEVSPDLIAEHAQNNSSVELTIIYGMAECSIASLWERGCDAKAIKRITVGEVIDGVELFVYDELGNIADIYEDGEIYVRSKYVAYGYKDDEELTAKKFSNDIANPEIRWFKTGDKGRRLPSGEIEFRGRLDFQMNIRGNLINPQEAENLINSYFDVDCIRIGARTIQKEAVVCYYLNKNYLSLLDDVLAYISTSLPSFLMPSKVFEVNGFPLTQVHKIDRKFLAEASYEEVVSSGYSHPVNESENRLTQIWADVLEVDQVGREAHFFLMGGHSLKALELVSKVKQEFSVSLGIKDIFEHARLFELAQYLEACDVVANESEKISKIDSQDFFVVSSAQRRLWLLGEMGAGGAEAYNMGGAYELEGDLDEEGFCWALGALVERHESLRTRIDLQEGEPVQVVCDAGEVSFEVGRIDMSGVPDREARLAALVREEQGKAFDLGEVPLMRAKLVRLEEKRYVLLLTIHHIVSDGWSMGVLVRDVGKLYEGYLGGKRSAGEILEPLCIHYKDYTAWQGERLGGENGEKLLNYWRGKLNDGALEPLDIPTDRPRGREMTYKGGAVKRLYSKEQLEGLHRLARQEGCTLFMVLVALTKVLLRRYSGQGEVTVGTGIAGRDHPDLKDQIGFYVNTLVLRDELGIRDSFVEVLGKVKGTMVDAYGHGEYPFDRLVEELGSVERDMSRNPLFDVMVMMGEDWSEGAGGSLSLEGVEIRPLEREQGSAKFDWTLTFNKSERGLALNVGYNSSLYDGWRMEALLGHFEVLLEQVLEQPGKKICDLELLTHKECSQVGRNFDGQSESSVAAGTVCEWFEKQAGRTPGAVALKGDSGSLTYAELDEQAEAVAVELVNRGCGLGDLIGLCIPRSMAAVVGIYGIQKAGGVYVPLDPSEPRERLEGMISRLGVKHVVSLEKYGALWPDMVAVDAVEAGVRMDNQPEISGEDYIYAIHTSGSTGTPKAAVVRHKGVANLTDWYVRELGVNPEDRFLLVSSLSFDLTQKNMFAPLKVGATVRMYEQEIYDPAEVRRIIGEEGITVINCTPSTFYPLLEGGYDALESLRVVVLGGEPVLHKSLEDWMGSGQCHARVMNGYGPTECSAVAAYGWLDEGMRDRHESAVLVRSLPGVRVQLLDTDQKLVPEGLGGEICISGVGVGGGYLGQPELTAEKFVDVGEVDGKVYRTGDMGRWLEDGSLEYLGRVDDQVKLRGHRIELGEIEAVLSKCEGVEQAVVVIRENTSGEKTLCGYWTGLEDCKDEIVDNLRSCLPPYMVPSQLTWLEELPLTRNGKVDRRNLPEPSWGANRSAVYEAPEGELEEVLAGIWEELLGVEQVGRNDDFFALGGDSLKLIAVTRKVHDRYRINMRMRSLFENSTLQQSAGLIGLVIDNNQKYETQETENTESGYI